MKMDSIVKIEKDSDGWHGSSDMHICLCVAAQSMLCFSPLQIKISLNMYPNARAKSLFHDHYGKELEIFKSALLDETNIRLVKSIPGQAVPNPFIVPSPLATDELNGVISRTPTTIAVRCDKTKFSTRLTLLTESDRNALTNGANVKATLTSPCVITIEIIELKYECRFPFPVNGDATILRVSRKSGWIEVTVACSIATQDEGGYFKFSPCCTRYWIRTCLQLESPVYQLCPTPSYQRSQSVGPMVSSAF
jgi:hypothetical protein